jgi:hypothetical protein
MMQMHPFKYKPPRVKTGDLRTPITFYEFAPNEGPEPGESEKQVLYEAWAKIDSVWLKDMEAAKANGTLEDITITIRDPQSDFLPTNKHYIGVNDRNFFNKRYQIKSVQPDMQDKAFITIVAGLVE